MTSPPLIERALGHKSSPALRTSGTSHTYQQILDRSAGLAFALLAGASDLNEARVALLAPAGMDYAAGQWAIWRAGGIFVPLSLSAPEPEWEYTLRDSEASIVLADPAMEPRIAPLCAKLALRLVRTDAHGDSAASLPGVAAERRAMILYTSGTTSKPKGVVSTHANIEAQIASLIQAWEWRANDRIPLFLPLHHIHGIINIMGCAFWAGATIEPFARFDPSVILERVRADAYTLFMAVPTIYVKLIQVIEAMPLEARAATTAAFRRMRLMVSGSAALPASVHQRWTELTGQKLLERYGMTEIGMALSNPYHGERRPGAVGQPLPGVQVRLKGESGAVIEVENEPGEIQVRGPGVFQSYWNRPEATAQSFEEGWFRTGDMAVLEDGYYRIMGRLSMDIIKSGGYKLSALEIEAALLEHPSIRECAVLGRPDETWGERVCAAIVPKENETLDPAALRAWCRDRLASYKIPRDFIMVLELPRNAMGKVTKAAVRPLFGAS